MYSSLFCRVYNEFGWNVYPEVFASRLLRWIERSGAAVRSALDLGCGTGVLCRELAGHGIEARGVDLSEGMISLARSQVPGACFEVGDMIEYRSDRSFDLVTCTGDALNHVSARGDLCRIFENVYAMLTPGGYFVFDLLGEGEIPDGEPFTLDYSDTVRAVFRTTRQGPVVRLHIEVFENGRLTVEENILETLHPADTVRVMLEEAGFEIDRFGHRLLDDEGEAAAWFAAVRKKEVRV